MSKQQVLKCLAQFSEEVRVYKILDGTGLSSTELDTWLKDLESQNMITKSTRRGKTLYAITEQGKKEIVTEEEPVQLPPLKKRIVDMVTERPGLDPDALADALKLFTFNQTRPSNYFYRLALEGLLQRGYRGGRIFYFPAGVPLPTGYKEHREKCFSIREQQVYELICENPGATERFLNNIVVLANPVLNSLREKGAIRVEKISRNKPYKYFAMEDV